MNQKRTKILRRQCVQAWLANSDTLSAKYKTLHSFCRGVRKAWARQDTPTKEKMAAVD